MREQGFYGLEVITEEADIPRVVVEAMHTQVKLDYRDSAPIQGLT